MSPVCTIVTQIQNEPIQKEGSCYCYCNLVYAGSGVTCSDINECETNDHNCDEIASCSNIVGSFICSCATGIADDGVDYDDIDECTDGSHNCDLALTPMTVMNVVLNMNMQVMVLFALI